MARFYGEIQGSRGEASRMGTAASGFHGHIRGWHVGAAVDMYAEDEGDRAVVYATTGSSGYGGRESIGAIRNVDGQLVLTPSAWVIAQVERAAKETAKLNRRIRRVRRNLEIDAAVTAESRGHTLGAWQPYEPSDGTEGKTASAECLQCGMSVHVDVSPMPNGINIHGEALALNCPHEAGDILDYCENVYMDGLADDITGDTEGTVGHVYRVHRFIVQTDLQGFHHLSASDTEDDAREVFAGLAKLANPDDDETEG